MLQKILLWCYVLLGIGAFCYGISTLLAFFRMLGNRRKDRPLSALAAGLFKADNFTEQGNRERRSFFSAALKSCLTIAGMALIVVLGVLTET